MLLLFLLFAPPPPAFFFYHHLHCNFTDVYCCCYISVAIVIATTIRSQLHILHSKSFVTFENLLQVPPFLFKQQALIYMASFFGHTHTHTHTHPHTLILFSLLLFPTLHLNVAFFFSPLHEPHAHTQQDIAGAV